MSSAFYEACLCSVVQSCVTLCDPLDHSPPFSPLSVEFPRQEYWSGLPFPPPGDLPDPGIEPTSPASPAWPGRFFITELPVEALCMKSSTKKNSRMLQVKESTVKGNQPGP